MTPIPFNKPYLAGKELEYIRAAHLGEHLSGNGPFTLKCESWLEEKIGCAGALLTHSGTAALEMAAILADIGPGDEVIMPSYSFVSTANAFVLRGGVPVFVDIRRDTMNIDESKIEAAVTSRTKAVVAVHYAGVACEMDPIMEIAGRHKLLVIEDAAQAIGAKYKGRPLGGIGHLGALSFHETKNIISGEGGALLVNDKRLVQRARIIRDKGTNRRDFLEGREDKYTWRDIGSSYSPSDILAAFLWAQLEEFGTIGDGRMRLWSFYHEGLAEGEARGIYRRPGIPPGCHHNAHMYYIVLPSLEKREALLAALNREGIQAIFHFVPLHLSPAGLKYGRAHGNLDATIEAGNGLIRLPLWMNLKAAEQERIIKAVLAGLS